MSSLQPFRRLLHCSCPPTWRQCSIAMRYAIVVSWYIVDDHRHFGNRHSQRSRNVVATHLVAAHLLIQTQVPESGVIKKAGSCPQNAFQRTSHQPTAPQTTKQRERRRGQVQRESESRRKGRKRSPRERKRKWWIHLLSGVHWWTRWEVHSLARENWKRGSRVTQSRLSGWTTRAQGKLNGTTRISSG